MGINNLGPCGLGVDEEEGMEDGSVVDFRILGAGEISGWTTRGSS